MAKSIVCMWQMVSVEPQTDWRGYVGGLVRIRVRTGADTWAD